MSWMAGLGQGLMGAGDSLSRYLVQRQQKTERTQDVAYRDKRAAAEDADRVAARAIQQKNLDLQTRTTDETLARAKRDEDRTTVERVLGALSIRGGRQGITPDIAQKANASGYGTFVQESTPTPIGLPGGGMTSATINAGPTAMPMIPANVQAQVAANDDRAEFNRERLSSQEQIAALAHQARMAQIGASSDAAAGRNEISTLRAQIAAMGLQSANVERAYTIARQRVEAMYEGNALANVDPNVIMEKQKAIDALATQLLAAAPGNFGDAAPVHLDLNAPPPPQFRATPGAAPRPVARPGGMPKPGDSQGLY